MNDIRNRLMRYASVGALIVALHAAEYRGVYTMFGGGGGGNTTTVQKSDPWSGQQPYLQQVFSQAAGLYNATGKWPQYYPQSTVAGFNPTETTALSDLTQAGTNSPVMNSAGNMATDILNGGMLSAGNPYFSKMADTVAAQIQPQLTSGFTAGNDMNNPGAAFAVSQGLANAEGNLAYQNYSDAEKQLTQWGSMAPQIYQGQLSGLNTALGAGQMEQQQAQTQLNDQISRYNYNQTLPFQMLNEYANMISGNYGNTTTLMQPYSNNTAQNALGAGLSTFGASQGAGNDNTTSTIASLAAAAAAIWSDRRLKKNIRHIGSLACGLPLYLFEYLWGGGQRIGVMADEVEKVAPEAVIAGPYGFKMVDYGRLPA